MAAKGHSALGYTSTLVGLTIVFSVLMMGITLRTYGIVANQYLGERQAYTASLIASMVRVGTGFGSVGENPLPRSIGPGGTLVCFVTPEGSGIPKGMGPRITAVIRESLTGYSTGRLSGSEYVPLGGWKAIFRLRSVGLAPVRSRDGVLLGIVAVVSGKLPGHVRVTYAGVLAIAVMALALLFVAVLGRRVLGVMSLGLVRVQEAADAYGMGDHTVRLDPADMRPWGEGMELLANTFNDMASSVQMEDERRRQLFAEISHELATPLTVMGTHIETLLMMGDAASEGTRRQMLETVMEGIGRLNRLILDIIDLSRLDSQEVRMEKQPVGIMRILESVAKEWGFRVHGDIRVVVDPPVSMEVWDSPVIEVDYQRMGQILDNLIQNAVKSMPEGGLVTLGATIDHFEGTVSLHVSDTGKGIPEPMQPFIFDRFHKGDYGNGLGEGGRGLGLAITKRLVELHGGRISVQSKEGEGTTFTMVFPMAGMKERDPEW